MAFDDWGFEVTREVPKFDLRKVNDVPLFPDGFLVGKTVTVEFTHVPTGLKFTRTDLLAPYNATRLQRYVVDGAASLEEHVTSQEVSLLGPFVPAEPAGDPRPQDVKDEAALEQAKVAYEQRLPSLTEALQAATESGDQKQIDGVNTKIAALTKAVDNAAKQVAISSATP